MSDHLCITVRWLDDRYHGQDTDGDPEWPPSPLRLFQTLLAGAYRRYSETDSFLAAFQWLQEETELSAPIIIAPRTQSGQPFTRYVPNNDSDKRFNRQDRLAAKAVRPTLLLDPLPIHYLWKLPEPLTAEARRHVGKLCEVARGVVTFGWGVDMATASGSILSEGRVESLQGERWMPSKDTTGAWRRIPCEGTLDALAERHKLFVGRLRFGKCAASESVVSNGFLFDVPPLDDSGFEVVGYRRATDPPRREVAVFALLKPDVSGFQAFDTARRALTVAGMTRCAAKLAAERSGEMWTNEKINAFILGHGAGSGDPKQAGEHVLVRSQRFAYLPLPSIEGRGDGKARVVGSVRRVMLYCFAEGCEDEIARARRMLSTQDLICETTKQSVALLSLIPGNEKVVRCYTQAASTWATVTPVVLPGYDDPNHLRRRMKDGKLSPEQQRRALEQLSDRVDGLLRKAIVHAGFSQELANHAELEWRKVGFWPGTDLADRYGVPDHLKRFPRFHVKLRWRDALGKPVQVCGPICLGGGRFYGLGLFAAL